MENDPARVAWWRDRADQYRVQAATAPTPGSALAYRALAECVDQLADRMQDGSITLRKKAAPVPPAAAR
jgi:hypothetical protein